MMILRSRFSEKEFVAVQVRLGSVRREWSEEFGVSYGSRTLSGRGRRREREATSGNSKGLSGMDSTLPHLKDSPERILDS